MTLAMSLAAALALCALTGAASAEPGPPKTYRVKS